MWNATTSAAVVALRFARWTVANESSGAGAFAESTTTVLPATEIAAFLGGFVPEENVVHWVLASQQPGTSDTSRVATDYLFSPGSVNAIANPTMDTRGEASGWFGWAKDDKIMELRAQFMRETDAAKRKKLAEAIQARAFEVATHVPLGEFDAPLAARKNVTGFFKQTGNFYWNLKKN